jgi:hypothetical protein
MIIRLNKFIKNFEKNKILIIFIPKAYKTKWIKYKITFFLKIFIKIYKQLTTKLKWLLIKKIMSILRINTGVKNLYLIETL